MTPIAILFMVIAIVVIWGGLAVSLRFLARNPLPPEDDDGPRRRLPSVPADGPQDDDGPARSSAGPG